MLFTRPDINVIIDEMKITKKLSKFRKEIKVNTMKEYRISAEEAKKRLIIGNQKCIKSAPILRKSERASSAIYKAYEKTLYR